MSKKLNYKDFRAKWKKEHKKFDMKKFNTAWNKHKGGEKKPVVKSKTVGPAPEKAVGPAPEKAVESAPEKVVEPEKPAEEIVVSSDVVVEPQVEVVYQPSEEPTVIEEPVEKTEKEVAEVSDDSDIDVSDSAMYRHVANAIHETASNFIKLATSGRFSVPKEKLDRLDECGVKLLKKYDKDGNILEYSPLIAYILTIADVGTEIYASVKEKEDDEVKKIG